MRGPPGIARGAGRRLIRRQSRLPPVPVAGPVQRPWTAVRPAPCGRRARSPGRARALPLPPWRAAASGRRRPAEDPAALEAIIDAVQRHLSDTVDALVVRTRPKEIARRSRPTPRSAPKTSSAPTTVSRVPRHRCRGRRRRAPRRARRRAAPGRRAGLASGGDLDLERHPPGTRARRPPAAVPDLPRPGAGVVDGEAGSGARPPASSSPPRPRSAVGWPGQLCGDRRARATGAGGRPRPVRPEDRAEVDSRSPLVLLRERDLHAVPAPVETDKTASACDRPTVTAPRRAATPATPPGGQRAAARLTCCAPFPASGATRSPPRTHVERHGDLVAFPLPRTPVLLVNALTARTGDAGRPPRLRQAPRAVRRARPGHRRGPADRRRRHWRPAAGSPSPPSITGTRPPSRSRPRPPAGSCGNSRRRARKPWTSTAPRSPR